MDEPRRKPNTNHSIEVLRSGPLNKRPAHRTLLHIWLTQRGFSRDGFARKVGCNGKMVDYWCDGRCIPTLPYAFMIEKVTEGGVPASMWLGTPIGRIVWARIQERARK